MSDNVIIELIPLILFLIAVGLLFMYYPTREGVVSRNGRIIVRCNAGHLFTTIWIPFVSFKAIRLGPFRFQYCPVGGHWAFVTPIKESDLSEADQQIAAQNQDSNIP